MGGNVIYDLSKKFAIRIVNLYVFLKDNSSLKFEYMAMRP